MRRDGQGDRQCKDCSKGQYNTKVRQTTCTSCPVGFAKTMKGPGSCKECASGFYEDQEGGQGVPQISQIGAPNCKACSSGQFNKEAGQTKCSICPAGFSANAVGFGDEKPLLTNCKACPAGYFANEAGTVDCHECASGQYSEIIEKSSPYINSGAALCTFCPVGFSSQNGVGILKSNCLGCPAGYFANKAGTADCQECASGLYTEAAEAALCIGCPAGLYGDIVVPGSSQGSTIDSACPNECALGKWSATIGMAFTEERCSEKCSAGKYSNEVGNDSADKCKLCPKGKMSGGVGLKIPLECAECRPGLYNDVPGSVSCTACAVGMFVGTFDTARCSICPANMYQDELGSPSCKVCAGDTKIDDNKKDATAHDAPSDCSLSGKSCNKTLRRTEDGNCEKCASGSEVSPQQTSCRLCPVGKYNDVAGEICKNCANDDALCSFIAGSTSQASSTETSVLQKLLQKRTEQDSNDNADIHYVAEVTELNTLQTPKGCQERSKSYFEKTYDGLPGTTTIPIYSTLFAVCFTIVVSHRCFPLSCKVVDVMFAKSHYIEVSCLFVCLLLSL